MQRRFPRSVVALLATGTAGVLVGVRMQWLLLSGGVWAGMSFETRAGMHTGLGYGSALDPLFLAGFLVALVALATPGRRRLTRGPVAGTLLVLSVMTVGRFLTEFSSPPLEWTTHSDVVTMDLLALGVFGAFAGARRGRATFAGLSLWLSGLSVGGVTLFHVLTVAGRDGISGRPPLEFVLAPGVFVALGGAALLVLAGTLVSRTGLARPESSTLHRPTVSDRSSSDWPGSLAGSRGVASLALVCCALAAAVASTWFAWLVPEPAVLDNAAWTAGKEAFVASFQSDSPATSTWRAGLSAGKLLFLGQAVACVSLVGVLARRSRTLAAHGLLATGVLVGLAPLWRYDWSLYRQAELWSRQVPAIGLALALAAGGLLVVAGALQYETADEGLRGTGSGLTSGRERWGVLATATCGVACVAVGTWFHWLVSLGSVAVPIPPAVPWLGGGPLGSTVPVVAVAVLGSGVSVATTVVLDRDALAGGLLAETGLVVCAVTCWRVLAVTGPDTVLLSTFYVGPGVTLTLLGGFLLVATGGITLGTAGYGGTPILAPGDDAADLADEVLGETDSAGGD